MLVMEVHHVLVLIFENFPFVPRVRKEVVSLKFAIIVWLRKQRLVHRIELWLRRSGPTELRSLLDLFRIILKLGQIVLTVYFLPAGQQHIFQAA
jgi:hypothetical protein